MSDLNLTERAHLEFKQFMESSRKALAQTIRDQANELMTTVYTDYGMFLETDAWINYRENLRAELRGGYHREILNSEECAWARSVRDFIFNEHRAELVEMINKDLMVKIKSLEEELRRSRY